MAAPPPSSGEGGLKRKQDTTYTFPPSTARKKKATVVTQVQAESDIPTKQATGAFAEGAQQVDTMSYCPDEYPASATVQNVPDKSTDPKHKISTSLDGKTSPSDIAATGSGDDLAGLAPPSKRQRPTATGVARKTDAAAHAKKLSDRYGGKTVAEIMPVGYRHDSHKSPSKELVFGLCRLANIDGHELPGLMDLRGWLVAGVNARLTMCADREERDAQRFVMVSDVDYAVELRKQCAEEMTEDEGESQHAEGEDSTVEKSPLKEIQHPRPYRAGPGPEVLEEPNIESQASKLLPDEFTAQDVMSPMLMSTGSAQGSSTSPESPNPKPCDTQLWTQKFTTIILNNADAMLINRVEAAEAVASELHRKTWPDKYYNNTKEREDEMHDKLREICKQWKDAMRHHSNEFQMLLWKNRLLSQEGVGVTKSEGNNLLRHVQDEWQWNELNRNLEIKFVKQYKFLTAVSENGRRFFTG